jgi:hypothetical protein
VRATRTTRKSIAMGQSEKLARSTSLATDQEKIGGAQGNIFSDGGHVLRQEPKHFAVGTDDVHKMCMSRE